MTSQILYVASKYGISYCESPFISKSAMYFKQYSDVALENDNFFVVRMCKHILAKLLTVCFSNHASKIDLIFLVSYFPPNVPLSFLRI